MDYHDSMDKYIVIAGNIGAGKSTLVEKLCARMNWTPYYEPVSDNPYLKDFYESMETWSFHSQIFFLADRMANHHKLLGELRESTTTHIVQDRSIYEDGEIFARNLFLQGRMSERDYATYRKMYETAIAILPPPDLVVYLRASVPTLQKRIAMRARDMEASIPEEYLAGLNRLYHDWTGSYSLSPLLTVEADSTDFVETPGDLERVAEEIEQALSFGQGRLFGN